MNANQRTFPLADPRSQGKTLLCTEFSMTIHMDASLGNGLAIWPKAKAPEPECCRRSEVRAGDKEDGRALLTEDYNPIEGRAE